jgi:prepilin-type N-terminal cleavage/methylation domain-containing protein
MRKCLGFTILELLIVVAIISVIVGVGMPNLDGWNCKRQAKNDFNELVGFLESLRSEAIYKNRTMMSRVSVMKKNAFQGYSSRVSGTARSCSGTNWDLRNPAYGLMNPDVQLVKSNIHLGGDICFHPDGSVTMSGVSNSTYRIRSVCGAARLEYAVTVFTSTGFLGKKVTDLSTGKQKEL